MVGHRSTRNKMRFQMDKVIDHLNRTFKHFQYLEELAEGRSPFIDGNLPIVVAAVSELREGIKRFRESL